MSQNSSTESSTSAFSMLSDDLKLGGLQWPLIRHMAWQDLRIRYARTIIGPFWITITLGVYVLAMAFVFGGLFNTPLAVQLPWITLGLITFGFMATVMTESSTVLINNKSLMLQQRMSVSIWAVFITLRNLITGAHHLIVFVAMVLIMKLDVSTAWLLAIPGIAIVSVFAFGLGLLVAVGSTRFRDLPPLLNNVHTVGLLAVPVLWRPDDLQRYREIADYNPVTYLMAVVREPLLGRIPDANTYMIAVAAAVIALAVGLWALAATRRRIMLWL